jgi:hypothetical protein
MREPVSLDACLDRSAIAWEQIAGADRVIRRPPTPTLRVPPAPWIVRGSRLRLFAFRTARRSSYRTLREHYRHSSVNLEPVSKPAEVRLKPDTANGFETSCGVASTNFGDATTARPKANC